MEAKQILKSDILDIIFENRNKAYGAYDIRIKYNVRVRKALIVVVSSLVLILLLPTIISWLSKAAPPVKPPEKVVNVSVLQPPPPLEKPPPPPDIPKPPPPKLLTFKPPKIVKTQVLDTMPTVTELKKQPVVVAATTGTSMNFTPPPAQQKVIEQPKPEQIYTTFDEPPIPPGGAEGYVKYLQEHIHYPQQAVDAGAAGTVIVSITVSRDGTLSDVHIERDNVHYGCGDEAVRVIKGMPPWKPGKMNGVAVKVKYDVPVKFTLH